MRIVHSINMREKIGAFYKTNYISSKRKYSMALRLEGLFAVPFREGPEKV